MTDCLKVPNRSAVEGGFALATGGTLFLSESGSSRIIDHMLKVPASSPYVVSVICSLLLSCGPPGQSDEGGADCIPLGVETVVNREVMTVSWIPNCSRINSGFNIYISQQPLAATYPGTEVPDEIRPYNKQPFPGDTDPSDGREHFEAVGLTDGLPYYVSVRIVYPDGTVSKPSEEIMAVCGARGEIELSLRFKSKKDGFSFGRNDYVRADGVDNDLYFFSRDGEDFLASPTRLGGFLRATKLAILPFRGELEDIGPTLEASSPTSDRVEIGVGDWLHLLTDNGGEAILKVKSFAGQGDQRRIHLQYAFSPGPGPLVF